MKHEFVFYIFKELFCYFIWELIAMICHMPIRFLIIFALKLFCESWNVYVEICFILLKENSYHDDSLNILKWLCMTLDWKIKCYWNRFAYN